MTWSDWLVVKQSLEDELYLEAAVREIGCATDMVMLVELCKQLTRQNWHQTKLLKQAVDRVVELEARSQFE
jgi:hypothetical protein|tara:strand:- start:582 stop:794 length:213 start_codon:yes stop_codon:yes gene_type:complete